MNQAHHSLGPVQAGQRTQDRTEAPPPSHPHPPQEPTVTHDLDECIGTLTPPITGAPTRRPACMSPDPDDDRPADGDLPADLARTRPLPAWYPHWSTVTYPIDEADPWAHHGDDLLATRKD